MQVCDDGYAVSAYEKSRAQPRRAALCTAIERDGGQPWIELALAANGFERRVAYRSPFQLSAMLAASRTTMICTTARLLAKQLAPVANVRLLAAPRELPKIAYRISHIAYRMAWHRRLRDDAVHSWLRHQLSGIAKDLIATA